MNIRGFLRKFTGGNSDEPTDVLRDYYIDSPRATHIKSDKLHIEGWIIPEKADEHYSLIIELNGHRSALEINEARPDVAHHFAEYYDEEKIINCGFSTDIEYEDGTLIIWLSNQGKDILELHRVDVEFSPEDTVDMLSNPELGVLMAEHNVLLGNTKSYHYEKNHEKSYEAHPDDVKPIAFYLPQFHPIVENDKVWGKGFTEWTNVSAGQPRFVGHNQPFLPGEFGFYDLRISDKIKEQINLAKQHGIHGFCFYYYWFSGRKILDMPLETFLGHKEWDFNFMICWANENWTKRWDGQNHEVIISQEYNEDDPLNFIKDIEHILNDPRYIQVGGKPVLMVYRASDLKEPSRYTQVWRDYFKKKYNKELLLISSMGFEVEDPRTYGFDIGLDFAPQTTFFKKDAFMNGEFPYIDGKVKLLDRRFNGSIASYRTLALNSFINDYFNFPVIKSIPTSWDNDARRKGSGFVLYGSTPDLFGKWLSSALKNTYSDLPLVFINAWNEWAEGAVLEPTRLTGYAHINRLTEVIASQSKNKANAKNFPLYGIKVKKKYDTASYIHLYKNFDEAILIDIINARYAKNDIYITATLKYKDVVSRLKEKFPNIAVTTVPNRGGEILPFAVSTRRYGLDTYKTLEKLSLGSERVANITTAKEVAVDDLNGTVILHSPFEQLTTLKWLDVEDFEGVK